MKNEIVHRRDAENAKKRDVFLSAERAERKNSRFEDLTELR